MVRRGDYVTVYEGAIGSQGFVERIGDGKLVIRKEKSGALREFPLKLVTVENNYQSCFATNMKR